MSKVTDCARALGQAIVDSEEYKAMQITEKTAMNDPAVAAAMSRYLEAKDGMHTAMSAGNADEIARFSHPAVFTYYGGDAGRVLLSGQ